MCVLVLFTNLSETFFFLVRRIERYIIINYTVLGIKYPSLLPRFDENLISLTHFSDITIVLNFMKISSVGTELSHSNGQREERRERQRERERERQTDRRTDMTKLIFRFSQFFCERTLKKPFM
jgi:hypothetical protein